MNFFFRYFFYNIVNVKSKGAESMLQVRKWYVVHGILWIIGMCLLSGCDKQKAEMEETIVDDFVSYETIEVETLPIYEKREDYHWVYLYDTFVSEAGRFGYSQEKEILEFYDWTTNEVYPLCTKTNCRHDENSCNAYFPYKDGWPTSFYYDGQYLYYEYSQDGEKTQWYRQNLDGSDRTKLFSVDEDFGRGWVIYREHMVYFVTYIYEVNEEIGSNGEQTGIMRYHIYVGNLENGEVYPLKCIF